MCCIPWFFILFGKMVGSIDDMNPPILMNHTDIIEPQPWLRSSTDEKMMIHIIIIMTADILAIAFLCLICLHNMKFVDLNDIDFEEDSGI